MKKAMVVALTGRSGSGKGEAARLFQMRGIPVLNSDDIARNAVDNPSCMNILKQEFGSDICNENGQLNRQLLANRAFATKETAEKLVQITHSYIVEELLAGVFEQQQKGADVVIVDGSTIIDGPFYQYCDKIIVVESDDGNRIKRLLKRDNISEKMALQRLAIQPTDEMFAKAADYIIKNNSTLEELSKQVDNAVVLLEGWVHEAKEK